MTEHTNKTLRPYLEKTSDDLFYHGVSLRKLAKQYGTPFYVYSAQRIRDNFRTLKQSFEKYYPKVHVCYAVKANSNPHILKILQQEGSGTDCTSSYEIEYAKNAGFDLSKSLFTSVNPSPKDLISAVENGLILNLDDGPLIDDVMEILGKAPGFLSFRVNPGVGSGKFNQIIVGGKGSKFGIPESQALEAYRVAQSKGVRRFGLHMMTGSCILDVSYFEQITDKILSIAGQIKKTLGIDFEFIDLGGGFGIPYEADETQLDMDQLAQRVCARFKEGCARENLGQPTLAFEPGRYFVGDAGVMVSRVNHIKHADKMFLGLDAGMTTLIRPALYGAYHQIVNINQAMPVGTQDSADNPLVTYDVVGPICESTDCFAKDRKLPKSHKGDLVAFLDAGAYGWAMSMSFNGRPQPIELLVDDGHSSLIRDVQYVNNLT